MKITPITNNGLFPLMLLAMVLEFSGCSKTNEPVALPPKAQSTPAPQAIDCTPWKKERIDLPLSFAPEIKYQGYEVLRFAPGMFDVNKDDYFTYAFVMNIKNEGIDNEKELEELLLLYFKGLMKAVTAKDEAPLDTSNFEVDVTKTKEGFNVLANIADGFVTKQELALNMEVTQNKTSAGSCLRVSASPKATNSQTWNLLRQVQHACLVCEE